MSAWRSENVWDEVGLHREDLVDVRRREGAHAWLLAARLRWAHDVTGYPDDAVLLAEQINRFDGLFVKTNDSAWRKHGPRVRSAYPQGNFADGYDGDPGSKP